MGNHYSFEELKRDFGVEFAFDLGLSQFGGLAPFIEFFKKGGFRKRLCSEFGSHRGRSVSQLIFGLVAGARNFREVSRVSQDSLLRKTIGNPVGDAQIGRDLKSFTRAEIEAFHDFNVSLSLFDLLEGVPQDQELIFDIDATAVEKYGNQEGVERGFVSNDQIEKCYQYFFIRLSNLDTILYGTIRGGSAHSQNDFRGHLQRFLPMFKQKWKTCYRADSGFFNEEAFDDFSDNDATFFIKAPMNESRQKMVYSADLQWFSDPRDWDVQYASNITNTAKGTVFREIYRRFKKEILQPTLPGIHEYRYDCLASNDLRIRESEAFEKYNQRANIENNIKELKSDFALGKLITDCFNANDVMTQVTLLTYLLIQHFKRKILPKKMSRDQLGTLRWKVFSVPAKLLWSARREFLRVQNVFLNADKYREIFFNLKNVHSWVLKPPELVPG